MMQVFSSAGFPHCKKRQMLEYVRTPAFVGKAAERRQQTTYACSSDQQPAVDNDHCGPKNLGDPKAATTISARRRELTRFSVKSARLCPA